MADSNTSKSDCSFFQKYCEHAIGQLSENELEEFRQTKDENSRIQLLYEAATNIPITLNELNGKNYELSQSEKSKGNTYFAKKDYYNALKCYNDGIIKCPQNSGEAQELLSILISNRSATYFELKEYRQVLNDIDYLLEIGRYPLHLTYKIWIRKAKCYSALQNEKLAAESYDEAIKSLQFSNLDKETIETHEKKIATARATKIEYFPKQELVVQENPEIFQGGKEYIAASTNVKFEQDPDLGRYAVASDNIKTGSIIVEENAHCAVVDAKHALTNCQNCVSAVVQLVACPTCANVVFCSTTCERLANKSFHKTECPILGSLYLSGASINCCLALRIISQRYFSYFNDKRNKLKDYLIDNNEKNIIKKKIYRYDDYDNVFFLCRNDHLRKIEEMLRFSYMAIYLLRLLKFGKYFPFETSDGVLKEEEVYFGSLILRHLQLLQFNAHEVSELKNVEKPISTKGIADVREYENTTIGAALYPTLALFNHSCDPSIIRYNVKSKIVVRTIKPIKAGDIIYENYGPLYMSMQIKERQEALERLYRFKCLCTPCTQLWPTFAEMKEHELRIPCKTEGCPFVFNLKGDGEPFFTCNYCHSTHCVLPNLKGLMMLEELLPEAENFYTTGNLKSALNKFIQALEVLYKHTSPPHPEIIKIQQRMRNCIIHMGNKACGYKMKL
ncbi:SET and MYND domain-containing protein 4 [Diabrotica virgifera virgifera]|uniref:Protein-lysine N-methyltransferase SMYD4 n=1 Tax=Diabrotica virgifera virgifera TaxID=50390 RepID=A0A6P7GJY5_DIAVI|nr:SET and MYND domain-containing protein 4 [Diabrotica virgifera virgifera]